MQQADEDDGRLVAIRVPKRFCPISPFRPLLPASLSKRAYTVVTGLMQPAYECVVCVDALCARKGGAKGARKGVEGVLLNTDQLPVDVEQGF